MKKGFSVIEIIVVVLIVAVLGFVIWQAFHTSPNTTTSAIAIPAPTNYVVDEAGVLSSSTLFTLDSKLGTFDIDSSNTAQIAVLVVTSTQSDTIEQYSNLVFNSWKIGYKGSNNGILFVLATVDRNARIEVGTGFEGVLTDVQAESILQTYGVPAFAKGDWNGGTTAVVNELIKELNK
jgi:uncharacterized protein